MSFFQRYKFLTEFAICTSYAIYLRCDMLPCGNEIKEFISYRNRMKWGYIEFAKQIYRTSASEYIANKIKIFLWFGFPRKNDLFRQVVFSVIFACGKLYCCAVIFGLRRVILCFAQFNGKYNITETEGFNITFALTKISLQRSWNITKNSLHLYCSTLPKRNDNFRKESCRFLYSLEFATQIV